MLEIALVTDHQRRVQRGRHRPHDVIADEDRQREDDEVDDDGIGAVMVYSDAEVLSRRDAEMPGRANPGCPLRLCVSWRDSFLRHDLPGIADQRRLHDLVVAGDLELAGLQVEGQREEVEHIARV